MCWILFVHVAISSMPLRRLRIPPEHTVGHHHFPNPSRYFLRGGLRVHLHHTVWLVSSPRNDAITRQEDHSSDLSLPRLDRFPIV
jgi:hypothetical protein